MSHCGALACLTVRLALYICPVRAKIWQVAWILFADAPQPAKVEKLDGGALRVSGRLARTGIQVYAPWPGAKIQDRPIRVLRPADQVFDQASLDSLRGIPVTVGHPKEKRVTADTWKKYAVGHVEGISTKRVQDGADEYVETSMIISDGPTVKEVEGKGLTEISQGYMTEVDWVSGTTDAGEDYDAIQTAIKHNHTALLGANEARAGQGARVLIDSNLEVKGMKLAELQKLTKQLLTDAKLDQKLEAQGAPMLKGLEKVVDELDEEMVKKIVAEVVTALKAAPTEETNPAQDEEPTEEEKAAAEKKKKEEEAAKTDEKERAKQEALKVLADTKRDATQDAVDLLDARDAVRDMVPTGYDFKGKSIRQMHLDAIEACAPKLRKTLNDKDSDAKISGAFEALKASETKWIADTNDGKGKAPAEHLEKYNKAMNSSFADSWGKKGRVA